jgi:glutathione S-transferase
MRHVVLYRAEWSTNCERVGLALAHKGIEAESVVISYSDRSAVERVSGQGLVPVIDDDGEVVADSTAILRHLEERYPDPPLFPADPTRRAEVDVFLDWFNQVWKRPANELEEVLEGDSPDPARVEALSAEIQDSLTRFEELLAGRDFLMGDVLGAADCAAFPFLKYGRLRDPADTELFHVMLDEHQDLGSLPRVAAWVERVNALPRAY